MFGMPEVSVKRYDQLIARETILRQICKYVDSRSGYINDDVVRSLIKGAFDDEKPRSEVTMYADNGAIVKAVREELDREAEEATNA